MRIALNACLLVLLFVFTGCGSITSRWRGERAAYAGVHFDNDCVTHPLLGEEWLVPIALVDIPLSAVLDTFYLPYDLKARQDTSTDATKEAEERSEPAEAPASGRIGYTR